MAKGRGPERTPQLVDHISESDDESIDDDEAFNSEDERQYGAMFKSSKSKQQDSDADSDSDDDSEQSYDEDSDGIASDDDDEEGDGGQYMLDLLNNLDKKDDIQEQKQDARKKLAHSAMMQESEFSTAIKGGELTMDQLMNGISDTKGFGSVQKTMKHMTPSLYDEQSSKKLKTTQVPVAKVVSERAQRKVAYEENAEEVAQWTTVAKANREAETLDFRPKDRIKISKDELVGKFEATTDFEKEMAAALEEAGAADEKDLMEDDDAFEDSDDDLGRNELTEEEYRKRKGELAKMRALMFYEEQKRHHMNKIKSKKYRKIRKKQRSRLQDAENEEAAAQDEEYAKELEEKAEMERMKERMSLKHRNTSKWAKRVLRRGKNVDIDTRRALSEQVRIGDELKKKMQGNQSDSEDEQDHLLEQARLLLADTEKDDNGGKKKGIFEMEFMKKGLQAQRERAKQEARELLMELEANEGMSNEFDNDDDAEDGSDNEKQNKKKQAASAEEMEKVLPKGKLIAKSLEFGNSNAVAVSGAIDLDGGETEISSKKSQSESRKEIDVTLEDVDVEAVQKIKNAPKSSTPQTPSAKAKSKKTESESNPWMKNADSSDDEAEKEATKNSKRKKSAPAISRQGIINVSDAVNILTGNNQGDNSSLPIAEDGGEMQNKEQSKIASLTQEQLVKQAFATASDKDIENEFAKEKEAMKDRDDHTKKLQKDDKKVSGWGSWAGEGAPAPRPPKKLPKKLQAPEKKIQKRRRLDDGKKNVIISAKRMKKTAQFQVENIPFPYTSREQYDRAMAGSLGSEWNVSGATKAMTRPDVVTRVGKIIRPVSKKAKVKRAPLARTKF